MVYGVYVESLTVAETVNTLPPWQHTTRDMLVVCVVHDTTVVRPDVHPNDGITLQEICDIYSEYPIQ